MHIPFTARARHPRKRRTSKKPPGTVPGTLVYAGDEPTGPVHIEVFDYDAERVEERVVEDVEDCARYRDARTTTWIDVDGVHDAEIIERLGTLYGLHPLTLEDIMSPRQRPKLEEYPEYVYVVLQMMHYDHEGCVVEAEQVSLIVGEGFVLSFQEARQGDVFEPVRTRLREGRGIIRQGRADYLAYALIDVIVDHYMVILEGLGEHIEDVEDDVTLHPNRNRLHDINGLRRKVIVLRRAIWPLRQVIVALEKADHPFVTEAIDPYLRDVYDHIVWTVELIESAREILASLVELHLSMVSHRMNEVMKVLTMISVFFLPLTFIVGVYGMNFNPEASPLNMPELDWFYGYPFAWGIMLAVAASMFIYFRRKGWL